MTAFRTTDKVRLDPGLVAELQRRAEVRGVSLSELISELLLDVAPVVLAVAGWAYATRNAERGRNLSSQGIAPPSRGSLTA